MSEDGWSFVAMEYHALLLNRCFVVSIEGGSLRGRKCRGLTGDVTGRGGLSRLLHRRWAVEGDRNDPSSYIQDEPVDSTRGRGSRADFRIPLADIEAVRHDPRRKWGMGEYPHDGRIRVSTGRGEREFIVLGRQSASDICAHIRAAAGLARSLAAAQRDGATGAESSVSTSGSKNRVAD